MTFTRRDFLSALVAAAGSCQTALPFTVTTSSSIASLLPRSEEGHQFVIYGDSCSGRPGLRNEQNLKAVNQIVASLSPSPEFICFTGDNIQGSVPDTDELRRQWDYFFEKEMAWLDRRRTPFYCTTSNHNTYGADSERVWRQVFADLPQNGPDPQKGLSYYVRRGNLLLVCVNTNFSGFADGTKTTDWSPGHGRIEHEWLDRVLQENADATYKFVAGHVPAFPVNGYARFPVWRIVPQEAAAFWDVLVKHGVIAYLCGHVIAFDVQAHSGVLQITTGGAGTNAGPGGFMPGRTEYLHAVQASIDKQGFRYQVLDTNGERRESLQWPISALSNTSWKPVPAAGVAAALRPNRAFLTQQDSVRSLFAFRFSGTTSREGTLESQTLLCGWNNSEPSTTFWAGLEGGSHRLTVRLLPESGGSAEVWIGPTFTPGQPFQFELLLHGAMGPGGVLFRPGETDKWSSLQSGSARGLERLAWPPSWSIGNGESGSTDRPFLGQNLRLECREASLE